MYYLEHQEASQGNDVQTTTESVPIKAVDVNDLSVFSAVTDEYGLL
jgi:hypothetical protein